MKKTLFGTFASLVALAFVLSSCVGGRTEADPDKHPDYWKRKEARQQYRRN
jgi:hypothetical protein